MKFLPFKLLAVVIPALGLAGCGGDDPEETSTPAGMEEPAPTPTPDPDPEPEPNPFYVPSPEELCGKWRCVWHKSVSNTYIDDTFGWKSTTDVYNEEEWAARNQWPLNIEFYNNDYMLACFLPDDEKAEFIAAVENKSTWKSANGKVEYSGGSLKSGGFMWKFSTHNQDFSILFYSGGKFQYSWLVTEYDGNSFYVTIKTTIAWNWKSEDYYRFKRIID